MGVFAKTRRTDYNRCVEEFNTITIRQAPLLHWRKAINRKDLISALLYARI
jgi:hypothetical protein